MENPEEFKSWLFRCIADSKKKLNMSDRTIAYILLAEGLNYYLKEIAREELGIRDIKEHN